MNLRERALAALDHREVCPVPVDLFENGIYPALQVELARHYGLVEDDLEALMQRLGVAFRWARPVYAGPTPEVDLTQQPGYPHRVTYVNIWGTWSGLNSYSDLLRNPLATAETVGDIEAHHCGMDVQALMPSGKVNQVRAEVRRLVDMLGKDGGYICSTCHFLLDNVPAETW